MFLWAEAESPDLILIPSHPGLQLLLFPIWNECNPVAATSQLSRPDQDCSTSITFSNHHVMQNSRQYTTHSPCLNLFVQLKISPHHALPQQGSCPMWGALHSCVWPQLARDAVASSHWPGSQSRGLDRELWLVENAPADELRVQCEYWGAAAVCSYLHDDVALPRTGRAEQAGRRGEPIEISTLAPTSSSATNLLAFQKPMYYVAASLLEALWRICSQGKSASTAHEPVSKKTEVFSGFFRQGFWIRTFNAAMNISVHRSGTSLASQYCGRPVGCGHPHLDFFENICQEDVCRMRGCRMSLLSYIQI